MLELADSHLPAGSVSPTLRPSSGVLLKDLRIPLTEQLHHPLIADAPVPVEREAPYRLEGSLMTVGIPIAREQARVAEPRCMLDTLAGLHA